MTTQMETVADAHRLGPHDRRADVVLCGDRLASVPPDTEHDGWCCAEPAGHLPDVDHRAADGTTW